ncbi:MAG: hypothetical protein CVU08_14800 [Bacteroidetes bacterium HGW-Bacteroidetes-3]|jgi:hypothetical protein|nr:MAG: hypothetical protein CVU08_14800 [Bacteroidetes bacterium HGW-Bacteroidetes-3]
MKYIYKIVLLSLVIIGFVSCDANENFEILPPQDGITINNPVNGSTVVLDDTNISNPGLTINWSAPTLLGTGASFNVEVALTGTDFAAPVVIGTTETNVINLTVVELNTLALDVLEIPGETTASIDIRIVSGEQVSNRVSVILTPFSIEFTELYLTGSLTAWEPAQGLPFTRLGFNEFEITVDLADGDAFKFIPQTDKGWDGAWKEDPNNPGTLIDEPGDPNISGYPAGKYKIYVNLNTFTFTVTQITAPPTLFIVGDNTTPNWNPGISPQMNLVSEGVFALVIELQGPSKGFKFIPTNVNYDGDWGEDPANPGTIIQDGEQNLSGYEAGKYLVIVDFNTLTYKVTAVNSLYMVGSITNPDWNPAISPQMSEASLGIYSLVVDIADGDGFKFIPTNAGYDGDWGEDPAKPGSIIQDGEVNLSGYAAGKYVVAVNYNTLSFTVSAVSALPTNLYLVGQFNGWNAGAALPFTKISSGIFEITQTLTAGGEGFKFLPQQDWPNDWGESKTSPKVLEQGAEQNVIVNADGTYVITVDFNKGNFSTVLQ